jgi:5-(carboxyamino)imidazole ribonucleotide synthase
VAQFGEPCVLKARRQGYDGRGVLLPEGPQDPRLTGWEAPSLVEQRLELAAELAVLVVRGLDGAIRSYDPVQMEMDPQLHLLDVMVGPARVGPALGQRARQVAERAVEALGGVGAFGVELFVDQGGRILLNEVSPRVHNSGHHSLEACGTSQFENHLRAVLGWPLGDTGTLRPSALVNLLGPQGLRGGFQVRGLEQALALPGVHVHLYGKAETRPGRKLGHLTALASTAEEALHLARTARGTLSFVEAK